MDDRELFHARMHRESGDQLLHMEQGFLVSCAQRREQGLPVTVLNTSSMELTEGASLFDHFNIAGSLSCSFNEFCIPPFEERVLAQGNNRRRYVKERGVTLTERTEGDRSSARVSLPREEGFTLTTPRAYEENRHRPAGGIEKRVDRAWPESIATRLMLPRDYPVTLDVMGPFAFLRELIGAENAMVLPCTEPGMIRRMLDDHLSTCVAAAEPVIRACQPDLCFVWEDCCGGSGPFIAPDPLSLILYWNRVRRLHMTDRWHRDTSVPVDHPGR